MLMCAPGERGLLVQIGYISQLVVSRPLQHCSLIYESTNLSFHLYHSWAVIILQPVIGSKYFPVLRILLYKSGTISVTYQQKFMTTYVVSYAVMHSF